MTEKKKYIVTVTKVSGGWHGQEIRETKDIITYATSKDKRMEAEKQSEGQYSFDDYDDNVYQEPES